MTIDLLTSSNDSLLEGRTVREDIYGHIVEAPCDVVYATKNGLRMLRVTEVLPDRLKGIGMTGRCVTVKSEVARVFGWDFTPIKTKRRGRRGG